MSDGLFSITQAADIVGTSASRARRLAEEGRLPTARHGGGSWALTSWDVDALRAITQGKPGRPLLTADRLQALHETGRRRRAPKVFVTAEIADAANVSEMTVKRAAAAGELPSATKLGRQWFFTQRDVAYLRALYG